MKRNSKSKTKPEVKKEPKPGNKWSDVAEEGLKGGELTALNALINKTANKMLEADEAEAKAKALRQEVHRLTTHDLPEMLASTGTRSHETETGVKVKINNFLNGSLPKDEDSRKKALAWLEKNGGADIIKRNISMVFGRSSQKVTERVIAALRKLNVEFNNDLGVHPMTLSSFANERLKNGEDVPLDTLGLYAGRVAKITMPKELK